MAFIRATPCPIRTSGTPSRPSGISSAASTAIGITTTETTGIAARLANNPIGDTCWKCHAVNMAVASPATTDVIDRPMP